MDNTQSVKEHAGQETRENQETRPQKTNERVRPFHPADDSSSTQVVRAQNETRENQAIAAPDKRASQETPKQVDRYAALGEAEIHKMNDMPPRYQQEMQQQFAARGKAMEHRDTLEALQTKRELTQAENDKLSTARGQTNEASRQLGEKASEYYAREVRGATERVYPPGDGPSVSRPGEFDQVWKINENGQEKYLVIEAKGGDSRLGTRNVDGETVQQGTSEYFNGISAKMRGDSDPKIAQLGEDLRIARYEGHVEYVKVQAPIVTKEQKEVLGDVKVSRFILD